MPTFLVEGIAHGQSALFKTLLRRLNAQAQHISASGFEVNVRKSGKYGIVFDGVSLNEDFVRREFLSKLRESREGSGKYNITSVETKNVSPPEPEDEMPLTAESRKQYEETVSYLNEALQIADEISADDSRQKQILEGKASAIEHRCTTLVKENTALQNKVDELTLNFKNDLGALVEQMLFNQKDIYSKINDILIAVDSAFDPAVTLEQYVASKVQKEKKSPETKIMLTPWEETHYAKTNKTAYDKAKEDLKLSESIVLSADIPEETKKQILSRMGINLTDAEKIINEYNATKKHHEEGSEQISKLKTEFEKQYREQKQLVDRAKKEHSQQLLYALTVEIDTKINRLVLAAPFEKDVRDSYLPELLTTVLRDEANKTGLTLSDRSDENMLRLVLSGDKTNAVIDRLHILKERLIKRVHDEEQQGILFKIGYTLQPVYAELRK